MEEKICGWVRAQFVYSPSRLFQVKHEEELKESEKDQIQFEYFYDHNRYIGSCRINVWLGIQPKMKGWKNYLRKELRLIFNAEAKLSQIKEIEEG